MNLQPIIRYPTRWASALRSLPAPWRRWLPDACVLCRRNSGRGMDLCIDCERALMRNTPACPMCARAWFGDGICAACVAAPPPWDMAVAPFLYAGPIKRIITALKRGPGLVEARLLCMLQVEHLRRVYADEPHPCVDVPHPSVDEPHPSVDEPRLSIEGPRLSIEGPQTLIPLPISRRRRRERGFNQAALLAEGLGRMLDLPCANDVLRRCKDSPPQHTLSRSARLRNLRGAFECRAAPPKSVALVDDVMTTGTTARTACEVLRKAGAQTVHLWVTAYTPTDAVGLR